MITFTYDELITLLLTAFAISGVFSFAFTASIKHISHLQQLPATIMAMFTLCIIFLLTAELRPVQRYLIDKSYVLIDEIAVLLLTGVVIGTGVGAIVTAGYYYLKFGIIFKKL